MITFHHEAMALALLLLFAMAVGVGMAGAYFVSRWQHRRGNFFPPLENELKGVQNAREFTNDTPFFSPPSLWMAIYTNRPAYVQRALELQNLEPCSWEEGFSNAHRHRFFVSPPVAGWVLVMGPGLPDPADDVDATFRFVMAISRRLGLVQFFQADRITNHHAWVLADAGRVLRAYAWAGEALWNQGPPTAAERHLRMHCLKYGEESPRSGFGAPAFAIRNVEKIRHLAKSWSIDPSEVDISGTGETRGIAGDVEPYKIF